MNIRPFPNCPKPLFQSKARSKATDVKMTFFTLAMRCPFSTQGAYLPLVPQGRELIRDRVLIWDRALISFLFKTKLKYLLTKKTITETVTVTNIQWMFSNHERILLFLCANSFDSVTYINTTNKSSMVRYLWYPIHWAKFLLVTFTDSHHYGHWIFPPRVSAITGVDYTC